MIKYYKLYDLLNRRGLKTKDLLKLCNITDPTAAKLRKGESVTTAVIEKICKGLQVQPGDIMEYIPDENTSESE